MKMRNLSAARENMKADARNKNGNLLDVVALGKSIKLEIFEHITAQDSTYRLETSVKGWTYIRAGVGS